MINKFPLLFLSVLFLNCVSVTSVVSDSIKKPYTKPSFVILHGNDDKKLAKSISEELPAILKTNNLRSKVSLVTTSRFNELNASERINKAIQKGARDSDILIVFDPESGHYQGNKLILIIYTITGIDMKTKEEVWKAEFQTGDSFKIDRHAKSAAEKIIAKLKSDKVL